MERPSSKPDDPGVAYSRGLCKDCGAKIQPLGPSSRCTSCDTRFSEYVESGWGLSALVDERLTNRHLGYCYLCGNNFDGTNQQVCEDCQDRIDNDRRTKRLVRLSQVHNPYKSVWDTPETDNSVGLTPNHRIMAGRILQKAKYFQRRSERGGPRGREYLEEARSYVRIAAKLLERDKTLRKNR